MRRSVHDDFHVLSLMDFHLPNVSFTIVINFPMLYAGVVVKGCPCISEENKNHEK